MSSILPGLILRALESFTITSARRFGYRRIHSILLCRSPARPKTTDRLGLPGNLILRRSRTRSHAIEEGIAVLDLDRAAVAPGDFGLEPVDRTREERFILRLLPTVLAHPPRARDPAIVYEPHDAGRSVDLAKAPGRVRYVVALED
jgi:hypothetical protein